MVAGKRVVEVSNKNIEIARLSDEVSEQERKAMKQMRANDQLKEEHVRQHSLNNLLI